MPNGSKRRKCICNRTLEHGKTNICLPPESTQHLTGNAEASASVTEHMSPFHSPILPPLHRHQISPGESSQTILPVVAQKKVEHHEVDTKVKTLTDERLKVPLDDCHETKQKGVIENQQAAARSGQVPTTPTLHVLVAPFSHCPGAGSSVDSASHINDDEHFIDEIRPFVVSSKDRNTSGIITYKKNLDQKQWNKDQLQEYVRMRPSIESTPVTAADHIVHLVDCPAHSLTTLNIDGDEDGTVRALSVSSSSSELISSDEEPIVHDNAIGNELTADDEYHGSSWLLTEDELPENETYGIELERVLLLNSKVAKMLIVDILPLSFVENEGFLSMMACGAPEWVVPSAHYFAETAVPELYQQVLSQLCKALTQMEGKKLHLTMNIWSSADRATYVCFTAHWVSFESVDAGFASHTTASNLMHRQAALCLQIFEEECPNAQDVASKLDDVIKDWLVPRCMQVEFVTSDNNPVFQDALKILNIKHIPCFARVLSSVVSRFLTSPDIVDLLNTARKICLHFSNSYKALKALARYQKQYHLRKRRIKLDDQNRWKSTLNMLERLDEQQKAIIKYTMSRQHAKNLQDITLTVNQWELIKFLCKVLSPFEEATVRASREKSGISEILPLICLLENSLITMQHECDQHNEQLNGMAHKMLACFKDDDCIKYIKDNDNYILATFLDPRFRDQVSRMTTCQSPEVTIERCKDILQTRLQAVLNLGEQEYRKVTVVPSSSSRTFSSVSKGSHQPASGSGADDSSRPSCLWSRLSNSSLLSTGRITPDSTREMVAAYLQDVYVIDAFDEPLQYWKGKEEFWPLLTCVAVEILGCPPTTVQPKRVTRAARAILNAKEINEYTEKMSRLTFLRMNRHLLPNNYILLPEQIPDSEDEAQEFDNDDEGYYRV